MKLSEVNMNTSVITVEQLNQIVQQKKAQLLQSRKIKKTESDSKDGEK